MGVSLQGTGYFVGKSESALTKYFGYEGEEYNEEGEYDKTLYFTNRVVKLTAAKQNVTRYKTSESKLVFRIFFAEYNDGCLHFIGNVNGVVGIRPHYKNVGVVENSPVYSPVYRHNSNDNAIVRTEVNKFNSEIQRLHAAASTDRQAVFQRTAIGSWYFVYKIENIPKSGIGAGGNHESFMWHNYEIYRVDVKADDRIQTESYTAATYNEYYDSFYDGNGNIISEERRDVICADYKEKGFDIISSEEGFSVVAHIKNGKVVSVE
jgi:hypothetical protein